MAQVLKLKRTAVQGKVPTTSSLELGELAVNTYDGKIYFEKDNGTPSVQSVVVTDATITGSINLIGAITASYFKGDGSQITNLPASDISQVATINYAFFNSSNIAVSHNFNSRNVIVSVYDSNYAQIIPSSVTLTDLNTATIVLSSAQSGYAVVAKGGHIVSGSADDSNNLNGEAGSYYLDFRNHTNVPSGLVSGSSQIVSILGPLNTFTASQETKNSTLATYTGSVNTTLTNIGTKFTTLGTYTGSIDTKNTTLGTYTGSIDTKWSTLQNVTSSLINATASYETKGRGIVSGSSQIVSILEPLNTYSSSLKTALELTGSNVIVLGDLSVRGTTTTINSTTIQLDDNIISLNAAGTSNGGIIVRDATGGNTNSGSLVWDVTNDYWKAGISGSESKILRANGDSVVSGSSQVDITQTTGYTTFSSSLNGRIVSLNAFTASENTKSTTLGTYTGSINTKFSTLGTYTGSIDTKWSTLQGVTSSLINATSSYETRGNGIVSSSTQIVSSLNDKSVNFGTGSITASYFVGDGSGITNVVTEIAEVATITSSFDNQSTISVTHNFNTKNVIVSVYGANDAQIIPSSVTLTNNNTATIVLSSADSGYAVVAKGGHIVSGSTDWNSVVNRPSGLVSGSSQITSLTTYKETITGNSIYTITHNLNEEYPIVQAWNTSNKRQEIPSIIESVSVNAISLTFSGTFSGLIIVKK
jgi:spore maturation protein SpmB